MTPYLTLPCTPLLILQLPCSRAVCQPHVSDATCDSAGLSVGAGSCGAGQPGGALAQLAALLTALLRHGAVQHSSEAQQRRLGQSLECFSTADTVPHHTLKLPSFSSLLLLIYPRSETYQYFNLPFCHPKEGKEYKPEGLGEVLEGDRLVSTPYKIKWVLGSGC